MIFFLHQEEKKVITFINPVIELNIHKKNTQTIFFYSFVFFFTIDIDLLLY